MSLWYSSGMISKTVEIHLDTFDPDILTKPKDQISKAMDEEVKVFNQSMLRAGQQMLTAYERTILKTYLAYKLGLPLVQAK